ncbi:hypothetical protein Cni_G10548 [Canna indica]|uniref:RING-type domain-containing protein n=1 Tax=Canna indica TaxID=4628 RepID=A0AAQ3QA03_9LILI|nr:hypothetical protein Cni_G10548 [Canna indica]
MASSSGELIMDALLRLSSRSFSNLSLSLSSDLSLHRRRLAFLLLSPFHFFLTVSYLRSLSFPEKTLLLARHLLSSLQKLLPPSLSSPSSAHRLRLRDLDAALLLMAMCDSYDVHDRAARPSNWRSVISDAVLRSTLSPSGLGLDAWVVVCHYVDAAAKCRRLMEVLAAGGGGEKVGSAAAAVVALPSVECAEGGRECAICKEEIEKGREVCELPCLHRFHWGCALRWLRRRSTCPCCRHELPTEDVYREMRRVWREVGKMGEQNQWRT